MLTASGGAWNASIVAEYFHFQGKALSVAAWEHRLATPPIRGICRCCWRQRW